MFSSDLMNLLPVCREDEVQMLASVVSLVWKLNTRWHHFNFIGSLELSGSEISVHLR